MKLGNHLDFAQNEARNLVVHLNPSDPAGPVKGQLYFNNSNNTLWYFDGSAWVSAKGGVPDATTSVKGIVQLAGDLAGSAASPQIAAGVIVDADVNGSANIAESKLNLATDAAVGTGSRRTLGAGAQQAMPGNRTLDAISNPVAARAMNGQKITGMADGTAGTDAVTRQQLDAIVSGLDVKASCRAGTTATLTLTAPGAAIDGVTMAANDRVLVKNQSAGAENGIYIWNGAAVAMTRAADADTSAEVTAGLFTFVSEGTTNADSGWYLQTNNPIVLGTTALVFVQFSGAGQIVDGAGLLKTGNTLDVRVDAASIEISADILRVKALGITNAMLAGSIDAATKMTGMLSVNNGGTAANTAPTARNNLGASGYYSSATHGAGTTITITQATHTCRASRGLMVQVQDEATGAVELADVVVAASGDVTVTFSQSQTANSKRVTIIG